MSSSNVKNNPELPNIKPVNNVNVKNNEVLVIVSNLIAKKVLH